MRARDLLPVKDEKRFQVLPGALLHVKTDSVGLSDHEKVPVAVGTCIAACTTAKEQDTKHTIPRTLHHFAA